MRWYSIYQLQLVSWINSLMNFGSSRISFHWLSCKEMLETREWNLWDKLKIAVLVLTRKITNVLLYFLVLYELRPLLNALVLAYIFIQLSRWQRLLSKGTHLSQHFPRTLLRSQFDMRHSTSTDGLTEYVDKQPVAWTDCCVEYWCEKVGKHLGMSIGSSYIIWRFMKTALYSYQ